MIRENRARAVLLSRASMVSQVLCFDKTVVAPFKLLAEHLRVKLTDMVEVISLRRDLRYASQNPPGSCGGSQGRAASR